MAQTHLTETRFDQLALSGPLLKGLDEAGFEHCTPIQARTLPAALDGKDIAGQAQTGTGKTAAFLLAMFDRLMRKPASPQRRDNDPRAVVIAPTRELAVQIHRDAETLGAHTGLRFGLVFGGIDYEKQRRYLEQGVDVLIGTPGRMIDYFKQKVFSLRAVEVLVLDEADRMFDLGFIKDIRYLLRRMPSRDQRLTMLYSATLSHRVMELAYEHMNEPTVVRIDPGQITVERVREVIYFPSNDEKLRLLIGLLKRMDPKRTLVFVNTKRAVEGVHDHLVANGIEAAAMSGDVPQAKRLRMLDAFQRGTLPVLIATDVASRGLHIPAVSHVFNYDLPVDAEDYVHRIGRTARLGAEGDAISFGCEEYVFSLPDIEKFIAHSIPRATIEPGMLVDELKRPPRKPKRPHQGASSKGSHGGSRRSQEKGSRRRSRRRHTPTK